MGEEKEEAVYQLHGERENFEKQLLTLVDQQEKILQEREGRVLICVGTWCWLCGGGGQLGRKRMHEAISLIANNIDNCIYRE